MKITPRFPVKSRKQSIVVVLGMNFLFIVTSCTVSGPTPSSPVSPVSTSTHDLILSAEADLLSVWATEADRQTAQDILGALQTRSGQICADVQTACQFSTTVEVYPDQASFDEHVMNPEMRGFFAISGDGYLIQMVSPANPSPHEISYKDGVLVAVHEFTHLALDEVNPSMPTWLDEGTAVYVGPHQPYATVCQYAFPFEMIPSFAQLDSDYHHVPAPDLFAYTVVDFIVHEHGMEKLNSLLRTPEKLDDILGVSKAAFEESWRRFIHAQYHNYKP